MTERTNWKPLLFFAMAGLCFYGYQKFPEVRKHFMGKVIEREQAFEICREVCQNNNSIVIGVLTSKGYIDPRLDNSIGGVIMDICDADCNTRISP